MPTIDVLFEANQLTIEDIAERAKIDPKRVLAIADGRWTPSPEERRRIAAAFGVAVEDINWGHTMDPRNIRYRRKGLPKEM